tara:strand:+ start:113 stop:490 length:378 start_codon:yes stop_codon:yes gene_type:complete
MNIKNKINFSILNLKNSFLIIFFFIICFSLLAKDINALDQSSGERLFKNYCAGCHINGGNIIRRSKNLKFSSLKRNNINDPEDIAKIARQGVGIMDGYEDILGENGDKVVANWVWEQAQKAWIQE